MVKRCFKCGIEKPIDDFYRHRMMADGHLGKCKDCTKLDMRIDRTTKPRVRAYDRERAKQPHRIEQTKRIHARIDMTHPERWMAHSAANNALRDGKLKRLTLCEGCGLPYPRLEKHHPDYFKPLLVIWLCKPCHAIADKIRCRLEMGA